MNDEGKLKLLEYRLHILSANEKDNQGVCRRLNREIRKFKAKLQSRQEDSTSN